MQAQGPLHLCVAQGRQTLKTPFTDLLLGKRRGSRRHRRRRRKCLLLGWRHVQRTKRSEEPRLETTEKRLRKRVAATSSKKFRRLEGDTTVTKLSNSFKFLSRLRTVFIFICSQRTASLQQLFSMHGSFAGFSNCESGHPILSTCMGLTHGHKLTSPLQPDGAMEPARGNSTRIRFSTRVNVTFSSTSLCYGPPPPTLVDGFALFFCWRSLLRIENKPSPKPTHLTTRHTRTQQQEWLNTNLHALCPTVVA